MAKKKPKPKERSGPKQVAGPSVTAVGMALPTIHVAGPRSDFRYTSPSAIPPRSAEARRAHGCETRTYAKGKKKFTGLLDEEHGGMPDTFCKATSAPCGDRQSCPVQLVWIKGAPHLRFCVTQGKPGHVVGVTSPEAAQKLADEACHDWPKPKKKVNWPKGFFQKHAPTVVARAAKTRPRSPWGSPGLGAAPRARSSSGIGLLLGTFVAGVVIARAMRTPPALPAPKEPPAIAPTVG